jgi:hypothetical protein
MHTINLILAGIDVELHLYSIFHIVGVNFEVLKGILK